jgi:hypothetical protein
MSLKDTESRIVVRRGRPRDLLDELTPHRDAARLEELDDVDHLRVRQRGELLIRVQAELRHRRQDGEPHLDAVRAPRVVRGHLRSGPLEEQLTLHHAARDELPLRVAVQYCAVAPAAARRGTVPGDAAQCRARPWPAPARGRAPARACRGPARQGAPQPKLESKLSDDEGGCALLMLVWLSRRELAAPALQPYPPASAFSLYFEYITAFSALAARQASRRRRPSRSRHAGACRHSWKACAAWKQARMA